MSLLYDWLAWCQHAVTEWNSKFNQQFLWQDEHCLCRSVSEIHFVCCLAIQQRHCEQTTRRMGSPLCVYCVCTLCVCVYCVCVWTKPAILHSLKWSFGKFLRLKKLPPHSIPWLIGYFVSMAANVTEGYAFRWTPICEHNTYMWTQHLYVKTTPICEHNHWRVCLQVDTYMWTQHLYVNTTLICEHNTYVWTQHLYVNTTPVCEHNHWRVCLQVDTYVWTQHLYVNTTPIYVNTITEGYAFRWTHICEQNGTSTKCTEPHMALSKHEFIYVSRHFATCLFWFSTVVPWELWTPLPLCCNQHVVCSRLSSSSTLTCRLSVFSPVDTESGRSSKRGKLRADMIGAPQNDLRHTGHIGYDGAVFGDVSFIGDNYDKLPLKVGASGKCSGECSVTWEWGTGHLSVCSLFVHCLLVCVLGFVCLFVHCLLICVLGFVCSLFVSLCSWFCVFVCSLFVNLCSWFCVFIVC